MSEREMNKWVELLQRLLATIEAANEMAQATTD